MAAISNSSPLILFAQTGRFELLRLVFGELLTPPAVRREVILAGAGQPGALEVGAATWNRVQAPVSIPAGARPFGPVGAGETEVIALALDLSWNEAVILDDRRARTIARQRGLRVIGSGGVLVEAKRFGLIAGVRPLLEQLLNAGLYLDRAAYGAILTTADERE